MILKVNPDLTKAYELKRNVPGLQQERHRWELQQMVRSSSDTFLEADLPCYRTFIATIRTGIKRSSIASSGLMTTAKAMRWQRTSMDHCVKQSQYQEVSRTLTASVPDQSTRWTSTSLIPSLIISRAEKEGKERGQYTKTAIDSKITDTDDTEPLKD